MRRSHVAVAFALLLVTFPLGRAGAAQDDPVASSPVAAVFEGRLIDLSEGWGEAGACVAWNNDSAVECFRDEAALLEHIAEREAAVQATATDVEASSTCSSSLRLYDGTGYTGSVLYLYQRTVWINLADYGFSNRTSSFKVGACSSYFADYANGGGSWYPTSSTQAWDVASAMISGWNNRVSSIYIT